MQILFAKGLLNTKSQMPYWTWFTPSDYKCLELLLHSLAGSSSLEYVCVRKSSMFRQA